MKQEVEFRIINTSEMPPIVITKNEDDEIKVVLNTYHKLWISLNRKVIAGCVEDLYNKMDTILQGYLQEQYNFEQEDLEFNEE